MDRDIDSKSSIRFGDPNSKYGFKKFEAKHNFLGGAAQAGAGCQGSENGGWLGT